MTRDDYTEPDRPETGTKGKSSRALKDGVSYSPTGNVECLILFSASNREKGITPSTREIQNHFGLASQTSVMQYIVALEQKGFLNRHARKARALITPAMKVRITDIPIYGQIAAGMSALTETASKGTCRWTRARQTC